MSPFDVIILECDDFSYEFCNDDIRKSILFVLFFPLLIGTEAMRLVEWVETISELWKWDSLYEFKPFRDKTIDLNQNQPPK